ncbi:MAG: murein biosynthesis integral membrane protein MurJ [Francisellaceae bacterium]
MKLKFLLHSAVIAFFTLISRLLGFLRDILLASSFGATSYMDAFLVAFKIPNFIRRLFSEGAFSQVLVPILRESHHPETNDQAKHFIRQFFSFLTLALFLLSLIAFIASGIIIMMIAPGFLSNSTQFSLTQSLFKLMLPFVFFMTLTAFLGSILNSYYRFAIPAMTPIILNVIMIVFILLSSHFNTPIYAVAWGVLLAGILQFLLQIPFVYRLGFSLIPDWHFTPKVRQSLAKLIPALLAASSVQISMLIETIFASFLPTGSLSWLYYPDRLNQLPLGIFGIALSVAILPYLSRYKNEPTPFNQLINTAMRLSLMLSLPAAVALCLLSMPLMMTLFHFGQFSLFDVRQSQYALIAFALGLPAFILIKIVISALYSKNLIRLALHITLICLAFNIISNFVLIAVLSPFSLGYLGLAISTTLSAWLNAIILLKIMAHRYQLKLLKTNFHFIIRLGGASGVMAILLFHLSGDINFWNQLTHLNRFFHLFMLILTGAGSYFLMLWLFGVRRKDILFTPSSN